MRLQHEGRDEGGEDVSRCLPEKMPAPAVIDTVASEPKLCAAPIEYRPGTAPPRQ